MRVIELGYALIENCVSLDERAESRPFRATAFLYRRDLAHVTRDDVLTVMTSPPAMLDEPDAMRFSMATAHWSASSRVLNVSLA
jgi:hypothetical protein